MQSSRTLAAAAVAALVVLAVLAIAGRGRARARFCAGPQNINLYDYPYRYPTYLARSSVRWDGDRRCAAYCGAGDCAIWCR